MYRTKKLGIEGREPVTVVLDGDGYIVMDEDAVFSTLDKIKEATDATYNISYGSYREGVVRFPNGTFMNWRYSDSNDY